MTARVFISYRTSDGADKATALARDLDRLFGDDQVFLDKDDLPAGSRWRDEIARTLHARPILLVLVTPQYLGAVDAAGGRRIDRPDDPARLELAAALAANAHVIPLMCDGVDRTPEAWTLPAPFDQLAELTWRRLRAYDWREDLARLAGDLERLGVVPRGERAGGGRGGMAVGGTDEAGAGKSVVFGTGTGTSTGSGTGMDAARPFADGVSGTGTGSGIGGAVLGTGIGTGTGAGTGMGSGTRTGPGIRTGTGDGGRGTSTGTGTGTGSGRRSLILAGGALALAALGGAGWWAWQRFGESQQRDPPLTGRWAARLGARGASVAAGGSPLLFDLVQEGDRVRLVSLPVDVESDPDWQNYRDFWQQHTGHPLRRVRYRGEGEVTADPGEPRRISIAVRIEAAAAGEPIDGGNLHGEVGEAGRRIEAKLWVNSEQAERVMVLRRQGPVPPR